MIVKHANPCGVAVGSDLATEYQRAFESDPESAFGGIIALSGEVDAALAERIVANPLADVLVAYGYEPAALEVLTSRRKNMRVLAAPVPVAGPISFRQFSGGFLVQESDVVGADRVGWRVVTERQPSTDEWPDVELAWRVCARSTSNAIVLARGRPGRRGRVRPAEPAGRGATRRRRRPPDVPWAVPARATPSSRSATGSTPSVTPATTVVVQPGGSVRDPEVIAAANERGVAMVFTEERHFRH